MRKDVVRNGRFAVRGVVAGKQGGLGADGACAPAISVGSRSPMWSKFRVSTPMARAAVSNIRGCGFDTPTSSEKTSAMK
ncbi:MAG: hypothetical protein ACOX5J_03945 [Candidatus Hydrogenedentales bacterium]